MTTDIAIATLAEAAGLEIEWIDAAGVARRVDDAALAALVDALGWPCGTQAERGDSAIALADAASMPPGFVTGDAGLPLTLPPAVAPPGARYRITLETGEHIDGTAADAGDHAVLPPLATPGYHALDIGARRVTLAIAPPRGRPFADRARDRVEDGMWGIAAQLYSLRRCGDGGFGDFTALAMLAAQAARQGAHAVAICPTHALFPALPERDSPYSPSSRRWHNVAYVDCDAVPGADAGDAAPPASGELDRAPLIDWPTVVPLKMRALRARFDAWRAHGEAGSAAFRRFRAAGGAALDAHARFDALQAFFVAQGIGADWRHWPAPWRTPDSPEVDAFAHAYDDDIAFHAYLQWCATCGLDGAQRAARDAGMAIGLIADLAVGSDRAGSDAWAHGAGLLGGVSLGAPPDLFNAAGQAWGVTTWSPAALRASGFAPFIDLLRATFAHAGGIRIDHVLGFARMWLVPDGASPRDGAYLRYPCDDLLRLVALESARHRAIAIGEDLGTVPAGFRERIAAHGIAGMRALWFERDADGTFRPPAVWDRDAVATTSTHDLPTVAGWWRGVDLGWKRAAADHARDAERDAAPDAASSAVADVSPVAVADPAADASHDTAPDAAPDTSPDASPDAAPDASPDASPDAPIDTSPDAAPDAAPDASPDVSPDAAPDTSLDASPDTARSVSAATAAREVERAALWRALQRAGCVPRDRDLPSPDAPPVDAVLAYVARSPSPLVMVPLEDLLALDQQPNLPGAPCGHPNWRRRMPRTVDTLFDADVRARIAAIAHARRLREPGT